MATVTLNRPPLNILDVGTIGELQRALARVQSAGEVQVLAIVHEGKAISSGMAIEDHTPDLSAPDRCSVDQSLCSGLHQLAEIELLHGCYAVQHAARSSVAVPAMSGTRSTCL